jgi:hypothetical protein
LGKAIVTVRDSSDDIEAFLSVFAALLLDNVLRFEEIAGRVTELVMGAGRPNRELIVALQAFDRLKQEFEALGDALSRYAGSTSALPTAGEERAQLGRDVIATITVADLRDRLLHRLQSGLPDGLPNCLPTLVPHVSEDLAAEVDVDVVF